MNLTANIWHDTNKMEGSGTRKIMKTQLNIDIDNFV